jgi:Domain of unknown function (DUF4389)
MTGREEPAPVLVAFAGPAPQSRLSVLFRVFMVIPHLFILWALAVTAYVIAMIGWFGALFTGRLPVFAADYLTGFLSWQTRVFGYAILLTGAYPPFTTEDADYPIGVAVRPGRLNRLAVLFRIVLLIPAWIMQSVIAYGAFTVVAFVSWLIVLASGRMPASLHAALAAAVRYQTRVLGYSLMLTSAYPGGLFGDSVPPQVAWSQPGYGHAQPGYWAPQGYGSPWRPVLSGTARKLMIGFIVLGALLAAGQSAIVVLATSGILTSAAASAELETDFVPVDSAIDNYAASAKACDGQLACLTSLDRQVAGTIGAFAGQVPNIRMPRGKAGAAAAALTAAAAHASGVFGSLGAAATASQYESITGSGTLQHSVSQMNQDYLALRNALGDR